MFVTVFTGSPIYSAQTSEIKQNNAAEFNPTVRDTSVQQRRGQDALRQSTQQIEIRQKAQDSRIPLFSEQGAEKERRSGMASLETRFLGVAWQEFNLQNYQNALDIFTTLSSTPETVWEAKYGMAMCLIRMKDLIRATKLLLEVSAIKPYLKDTLPNLVPLLIEQGQFEQAKTYAARIKGAQKNALLAKIDEEIFRQSVNLAKQNRDAEKSRAIIEKYQQELKQCIWPEKFAELAAVLAEGSDKPVALEMQHTLLKCTQNPDLRIGIYYSLKPLIPPLEMLELLEGDPVNSVALAPGYLDNISTLKLTSLYSLLPAEPANVEEVAARILKIKPGDPIALSALAWWRFNNNRHEDAMLLFTALQKDNPVSADHAIGMIYCLIKLKRYDEALELTGKYKSSETVLFLAKEIRLATLWEKVTSFGPDSAETETLAEEILALSPDDENIKLIRAWWYFRNDNFESSYNEFQKLYDSKPDVKDHSYGLAISLEKLGRLDEAIGVGEKHKGEDERSASLLADMYLNKAKAAYSDKKYLEAEKFAAKSLAGNPEDANTKELLELYKYKQTLFSRAMSVIEGLPGSSYGNLGHDLKDSTGFSVSASVRQGVDWFKLPGDIILNTYGEYKYSTRTNDKRYFDASGYGYGIEFKKSVFNLGAEYFWDTYTEQKQTTLTKLLYLSWFHDWTKRMWSADDDGLWLKMDALSGSTYGRITHDFTGLTGTGVSGYINQGIDWFTLPGVITFNTYAEYRLSFRTKDTLYYNSHGPATGFEFQKKPFTLGASYKWQIYPERGIVERQIGAYLRWYYDWDLKPSKDR